MSLCRRHSIPLVISLLLTACATLRPPAKTENPAPAAAPTPRPNLVGTVSTVDEEYKFVMIESYLTPPSGAALKAISPDGVETAVLTVSPQKWQHFITANIIKGSPQKGDQVFQ